MSTSLNLLTLVLIVCLVPSEAASFDETLGNTVRMLRGFSSPCGGRGRAVRFCRMNDTPNRDCKVVSCRKGTRNLFRCRCRAKPSASPVRIGPNLPCIKGNDKCVKGYSCSCAGRCRRNVSLKIKAVADDSLNLYICGGKKIGSTPFFGKVATIDYTGPCDNLIVELTNNELNQTKSSSNPAGVTILVEAGDKKFGTNSKLAGVTRLNVMADYQPAPGFQRNKLFFDYENWTPVIVVDLLKKFKPFADLDLLGAQPVGTTKSTAEPGVYGFRTNTPYC